MKFGLKEGIIRDMLNVFSSFPEVDEVILYGSRAKGNYKDGSDIDMVLAGKNLSLSQLNKNHKMQLTKAPDKNISINRRLFFIEKKFVVSFLTDMLYIGYNNIIGKSVMQANKTLEDSSVEEISKSMLAIFTDQLF